MLAAVRGRSINYSITATIPVVIALVAMAVASRIAVTLPFSPVPVTAQVAVVILCGLTLGAERAAVTQLIFLCGVAQGTIFTALGLCGPAALASPTAGFLVGFVPAAWVIGRITMKQDGLFTKIAAALAGIAVIYCCGTIWLSMYLGDFHRAIAIGVMPFISIDLLKAAAAIALSGTIKRSLKGRSV